MHTESPYAMTTLRSIHAMPRAQRGASRTMLLLLLLCLAGAAGGAYYWFVMRPSQTSASAGAPAGPASGDKKGGRRGGFDPSRPTPAVAAIARAADVGVYLNGLGSVVPVATVTVRSRVDGELLKVLFREGQVVKAGDLLAEIDPRPYQTQLAQAEGQMQRDQALLENARLDLERYRTLFQQDSIAKQQLDTQDALVRQYTGAVKVDQAAIDTAKLQLSYCRITAPVSGRLGLRQVDPGNIVRASDANGLVVITQLQPITVVFTIPEDNVRGVMKKLQSGGKLPVEAYDRSEKIRLATGLLITADNQIDTATGTVKLKAQFANADSSLFPNQFVNTRLLLETKSGATVIPSAAIQRGTRGTFVYAVKEDNTVSVRPVTLGPAQGDNIAIDEGLAPGERVIIDGADRLREGATVDLGGRERGPGKAGARKGDRAKGEGQAMPRGDGAPDAGKGAQPDKAAASETGSAERPRGPRGDGGGEGRREWRGEGRGPRPEKGADGTTDGGEKRELRKGGYRKSDDGSAPAAAK